MKENVRKKDTVPEQLRILELILWQKTQKLSKAKNRVYFKTNYNINILLNNLEENNR